MEPSHVSWAKVVGREREITIDFKFPTGLPHLGFYCQGPIFLHWYFGPSMDSDSPTDSLRVHEAGEEETQGSEPSGQNLDSDQAVVSFLPTYNSLG